MSPMRYQHVDKDGGQPSYRRGSAADDDVERQQRRRQSGNRNSNASSGVPGNRNANNNDDDAGNNNGVSGNGIPRRWIYDRVNGTSQIRRGSGSTTPRRQKPPCFLCFPPPVLKLCPWVLEENCLCRLLGWFGCCGGSTAAAGSTAGREPDAGGPVNDGGGPIRSATLKLSLTLNLLGLLVTVFAALALAEQTYDLLAVAAFGTADLQPTPGVENGGGGAAAVPTFPTVSLHLGLQALAVSNPSSADAGGPSEKVVPFDDFCTTPGMEQLMPMEDCAVCADARLYLLIGMLVALVAYLPTFATDCLRLYANYDVNCQKASSGVWGLVSLAGYGLVYYYYYYVCAASFYSGQVGYAADGAVVGDGSLPVAVLVDFAWTVGTGQICLFVGFGLKVLNFVCNCCVATPTITRDRQEQWQYERLAAKADETVDGVRRAGDDEGSDGDDSSSESSTSEGH